MRRLAFLFLILVSCTSGPTFRPGNSIPDDQGRVYLYRPSRFRGSIGHLVMMLDGNEIPALKNGTYAELNLMAGPHRLEFLKMMGGGYFGVLDFTLEKGKEVFVKVNVAPPCRQDNQKECFQFVDKENALKEITETKKIYP